MLEIARSLATLSAGLFAGAAVYINLVEHPARMTLGPAIAWAEWAPSYERATRMQVPLAVLASLTALAAWLTGGGATWLVGALLIASVIPFTLLVIMPTNRRLLSGALAPDSAEMERLLAHWNRLDGVRSMVSLLAFSLFVIGH
jgi:hypothetical protein